MKIKKSALLELIKEEIVAEAEMFNMSFDDLRDFDIPDPPEYQASDKAFNKVNEDFQEIAVMMQDENNYQEELLDIIKEIIINSPNLDAEAVAMQALPLLVKQLQTKLNQDPMMREGKIQEGVDPNDVMIMMMAIKKLLTSPYTGPLFAAVIAGMPVMAAYEKHVLGKMNKEQPPVDGGEM